MYFQQSLYQKILKKAEKSSRGHLGVLAEKDMEAKDHNVAVRVYCRILEKRMDSKVQTSNII